VYFLQLSFLLAQTYNYTTDVNQSLKNRTRFTSYMRASCTDLLRESVSYRKVATGLPSKVWWCTSEERKYKKRDHNTISDNVLLNCNIAWKKQTADLALVASRFSHALQQENFTNKWRRRCRVEAKNVTKNKLLKLVNSMKRYFLFAGINLNLNITKKEPEKCMFQG